MIDLVARQLVFEQCPSLAWHVMSCQKVAYNPSEIIYLAGDEVFLCTEDEYPTILTKKQANQLNLEYTAECLSMCDEFEKQPIKQLFYGSVIAELNVSSFDDFLQNIGQNLVQLSSALGWKNILLISDARRPYLAQESTYKPAADAEKTLLKMGVTRSSTEGIVFNEPTMPDFFTAMFSIVRWNASTPVICFASENSDVIGSLCKYGNIHFDCYSEDANSLLIQALERTGFQVLPDGICADNFKIRV